jgi:hypothetical protein
MQTPQGPVPHAGGSHGLQLRLTSFLRRCCLESDQRKLSKRILEAELAILRRTREPGLARREWQAMDIAMDILRDMRVRRHKPLYEHRR